MPATRNTQTGTSGQRHLGRGRRLRSGAAPHGPPDVGALAREAVISFLQDASKATAEREAARAGAAATDAEATVTAAAEDTAGDGASLADGILAPAPEPEAMPWDAIFAASPVAESEAWRASGHQRRRAGPDRGGGGQGGGGYRCRSPGVCRTAGRGRSRGRGRGPCGAVGHGIGGHGRGGRAAGKDQPAPGQAECGDHRRPCRNRDHRPRGGNIPRPLRQLRNTYDIPAGGVIRFITRTGQ